MGLIMKKLKCGLWHVCHVFYWFFHKEYNHDTHSFESPFWTCCTILLIVVFSPLWIPALIVGYPFYKAWEFGSKPSPCELRETNE